MIGRPLDVAIRARLEARPRSPAVAGCDVLLLAVRALRRRLENGETDVSSQLRAIGVLLDRLTAQVTR